MDDALKAMMMDSAALLSLEKMRENCGGPFGAVIVKDGKIIAKGFNQVTSSHDPTAHAEVQAIRQACQEQKTHKLTGAVIFSSCEPCPMCLAAIYWAGLEHIYFAQSREDAARIGFDDDFLYREINLPLAERSLAITHLPNQTAAKAMQEWQEKPDKIHY